MRQLVVVGSRRGSVELGVVQDEEIEELMRRRLQQREGG